MIKLIINASAASTAKLHMEAAWTFLTRPDGRDQWVCKFGSFAVRVTRQDDSSIVTEEGSERNAFD